MVDFVSPFLGGESASTLPAVDRSVKIFLPCCISEGFFSMVFTKDLTTC